MSPVLYNEENGIATLTLNRPETYHSLTKKLMDQLMEYLKKAEQNPQIRCIVITATGKAFCSGQNLNEYDTLEDIDIEEVLRTGYEPLIDLMRKLPKPIICGLNGIAAGAGASLAMACDIILAMEEATLSMAFVHIGLIPDGGSSWFLPRILGHHRALKLMMTGEKISADQAQEWGWISEVYPSDTFVAALKTAAEKMAQMPTKAIAGIKEAINASLQNSLDEQLYLERKLQIQAGRTDDFKEGINAFREKRRPVFEGK